MKTIKSLIIIVALLAGSAVMAQNVNSKSGERLKGPKAKNSRHVYKKDAESTPVLLIREKNMGPRAKNDKAGISKDAEFSSIESVKQPDVPSPFHKNRKNFKKKSNDYRVKEDESVAAK